jgi:hypothetical protein
MLCWCFLSLLLFLLVLLDGGVVWGWLCPEQVKIIITVVLMPLFIMRLSWDKYKTKSLQGLTHRVTPLSHQDGLLDLGEGTVLALTLKQGKELRTLLDNQDQLVMITN